ncbi:methyl-accepting chemotaxis protein [Cronbergia sp. UHCC 0137]|uniref:methyl-accepting chemotaxis protein n=1 Tax=Cronbergia sp. UHCC 0137 TaxID=3110239 RepID=UPI002B1F6B18|nr:methyl-accepting chemotaxis protein [Cronbergia sp. UHCC 0137]MEA5617914.1 methyl-accepting chemotaxis protein [Cronbergia sp. UHCC 0137]
MAISINDHNPTYQQAITAYVEQKYEDAAVLVDKVVQHSPDDPSSRLLRGHVYYVLQDYEIAQAEYQRVLNLTEDEEILNFANIGLENISQAMPTRLKDSDSQQGGNEDFYINEMSNGRLATEDTELLDMGVNDLNSFDLEGLENLEHPAGNDPFGAAIDDNSNFGHTEETSIMFGDDPFAVDSQNEDSDQATRLELPHFWQEDNPLDELEISSEENTIISQSNNYSSMAKTILKTPNSEENNSFGTFMESEMSLETVDFAANNFNEQNTKLDTREEATEVRSSSNFNSSTSSYLNGNLSLNEEEEVSSPDNIDQSQFVDDGFDLEAFESAFGAENFASFEETQHSEAKSQQNTGFLEDFDEFDDLGNIPGFELTEEVDFRNHQLGSEPVEDHFNSSTFSDRPSGEDSADLRKREEELFTITGAQEVVPVFSQSDTPSVNIEPTVNVEQGAFAFLENASLDTKQWYLAGAVGLASTVIAAVIGFAAMEFTPPQQRESVRNTGLVMALSAGIAGAVTAGSVGTLTLRQIRRTTKDLQAQFDAVRQGSLSVQATVYSEDELGYLATSFNEMTRVIFTTTNEAQRKAIEQEEAKENLQRQVIRLLDDVEGAARGDLTVQAEVTADVLGAVADAFNLTIQNLRDIVQQVKIAARDVTKGATNSETFARSLSSDASRQAQELALTLSSVQEMTKSIQRVAEAAQEAETVARDASRIAIQGGEAVENTVAGILEIRETVAETTRKVKRLAESSQEINSIVALVSQIASRTNLLALNASIEAARAGEAGRGFAIVADEVRQLADKSAKSLKEIEQIVMQIQSETSSVMTAMEEGTQQVIKGTKLAEEAKLALENIIQVAKHIDSLVRSITNDTVEQTETSSTVAQVMQSVELTAQENTQEAQRVSGALQHLVGVSRDLISSVERFRVETLESR